MLGVPALAGEVVGLLRSVDEPGARHETLRALAGAELDELFGVLASGSLPLPDVTPDAVPFGTPTARALSHLQREALLDAIRTTPPAGLRRFLEETVTGEADAGARRAALEVLAPVATASDLPYAITLVHEELPRRSREFEALVATVLERDARGYARIQDELSTKDEPVRAALIHGVGSASSVEAMRLLNRLLFNNDPRLVLALGEIARLAEVLAPPYDGTVVEAVRGFLSSTDPAVLAAAAEAVAAFDDATAVRDLIPLVDHDSSQVRSAARLALSDLTDLDFSDSQRWLLWYDAEREWWDSRWPALRPALRAAERDTIVPLLAETVSRRLERESLVTEIIPHLGHPDEVVRRLACQSLGQLGVWSATPSLLAAMNDPDEAVARSAWRALCTITRQDLAFDFTSCARFLEQAGEQ